MTKQLDIIDKLKRKGIKKLTTIKIDYSIWMNVVFV
tara:strand:- start:8 stop:115 length:108 start_codon:yes stop_codon:yes gene_type:complete